MATTSSTELELAAETARRAMVAGWTKSIADVAQENGITTLALEGILNKVSKENNNQDPSVRIDELSTWQDQKMKNSELKRNSLHKLSPGLRAYMEKKLGK